MESSVLIGLYFYANRISIRIGTSFFAKSGKRVGYFIGDPFKTNESCSLTRKNDYEISLEEERLKCVNLVSR